KKHDQYVVEGYDIDAYDESVLTGRSMAQIAGDAGSAEWKSRPAGGGKLKAAWLADAVAKLDKKKAATSGQKKKQKSLNTAEDAESAEKSRKDKHPTEDAGSTETPKNGAALSASSAVKSLDGAFKRPMPTTIHPMLATPVDEPFDGAEWLFEIKWDGYRAIAFIDDGKLRLVSRNQNELTERFPELKDLPKFVRAKSAILDGEVVALDDQGRASFTLMQQRTGFRPGGRRGPAKAEVPVLYYAFDLLYLDGYDLRKVALEDRKKKLASVLITGDAVRYSDHYERQGKALFEMARAKGLEGILAKKRDSIYQERRTTEWLKIKITHRLECVIGGYTEPEGSRAHFGSIVLGLYDKQGRLIHIGQAGSGFDQESLDEVWKLLKKRETKKNPFHGEVEALRKVYWVKPELVAEIEFAEWTGGASAGSGPKLRAPVFLGLRDDKDPKDCLLEPELKT
ncbi:MAG: non-homologous end-joining DNA ligase, partial [Candidatus Sulfotelmatobacter sp.]